MIQGVEHGLRGRGSYNVEVSLDGEWFKLKYLTQNLDTTISAIAIDAQRAFAEEYKKQLQKNIDEGGARFNYKPHSPKYAKYKARYEGPPGLFKWSGALKNAISIIPGRRGLFMVGIPNDLKRSKYHPKDENSLPIDEYANILEHGAYSRGVPARPIFSDTFRKSMEGLTGMKKFIESRIMFGFIKKGINVTKR